MPYALDYSAGRPRGAAVRAAGYPGVLRYVGFDPALRPKCITTAEYTDLTAHGVGVGLVYENAAGDALAGRAAGVIAAQRARHWADLIGFPTDRPIYFACDTDVVTPPQFAAVLEYLRGAGSVLGGPALVGVYGEADVMERAAAAGVAGWFWQTKAWSHGIVSSHAHLLQLVGAVRVDGIDCDRNEIHRPDWGQTGQPGPDHPEDDMPTADELWNTRRPWPPDVKDVPHVANAYDMADWTIGGNIAASRAADAAADTKAAVVKLAAQVAALTALVGQPGGLTAEQAHQIALDAAEQAVDGITITVHSEGEAG